MLPHQRLDVAPSLRIGEPAREALGLGRGELEVAVQVFVADLDILRQAELGREEVHDALSFDPEAQWGLSVERDVESARLRLSARQANPERHRPALVVTLEQQDLEARDLPAVLVEQLGQAQQSAAVQGVCPPQDPGDESQQAYERDALPDQIGRHKPLRIR